MATSNPMLKSIVRHGCTKHNAMLSVIDEEETPSLGEIKATRIPPKYVIQTQFKKDPSLALPSQRRRQAILDELFEINLGNVDEPRQDS